MREASGTKRTTEDDSPAAHQTAQTDYREATQVGNTTARSRTSEASLRPDVCDLPCARVVAAVVEAVSGFPRSRRSTRDQKCKSGKSVGEIQEECASGSNGTRKQRESRVMIDAAAAG